MAFDAIYFVNVSGGTYTATDTDGAVVFFGSSLVSDVLNAIEAAHAAGRFAVMFGVGDFNMGTEWWTLVGRHDILLAGAGMGATHVFNSTDAASDSEPFSFSGVYRATIRDMDISAGGSDRTTSDALDFDDGNYCLVERVRILDSRARGIVFDGKDAGKSAIGNVIRDCVIVQTRSAAGDGIELLGAERNLVEGNYITGVTENGIDVTKGSPTAGRPNAQSNYNRIIGNMIVGAGRNGIRVNSCRGNVISGNTVINSGQLVSGGDGIEFLTSDSQTCDDNVVTGNVCTDDQGTKTQPYGVVVTNADCNRTVIVGNSLVGNSTGAINDNGTGTVTAGNTT